MELEARAVGSEFALGAGDDRLRKRAGIADGNNAGPAGAARTAATSTAWQNDGQLAGG